MYFNLLFKLLIFLRIYSTVRSDKMCKSITPDAITQLQNGSIVLFEGKNLWFLKLSDDSKPLELSGPCPINKVFEEMEGPVDAAVTIETHESVIEFRGASIYFSNGYFYTFKNLRPYQVEWGDLIYLPVKGLQSKMGATVDVAKRLMSTKMTAAFFDPNSSKSKFIFADLTVLGYSFELGSEFDKPVVTDMAKELKKFGISILPKNITAVLTLMKSKQILFFQGSKFCSISFELSNLTNQKGCYNYPITKFFDCDNIKESDGNCAEPKLLPADKITDQTPIEMSEDESEEILTPNANVRVGNNEMTTKANTLSPPPATATAHPLSFCSLYRLIEILVFLVIAIF